MLGHHQQCLSEWSQQQKQSNIYVSLTECNALLNLHQLPHL